jgi:uncharacterized protein (TIGR00375 family)
MLFVDLHIHSPYARGTSSLMVPAQMAKFGKMKGLDIIGTGDCTLRRWLDEIKPQLSELGDGLYEYDGMGFVISGEISTIYKKGEKVRKIHHVVTVPSFDLAYNLIEELGKRGNLNSDGRPILGMSSPELVERIKSVDSRIHIIPAHIWTPWFSLFGSRSGFDSVEECYEDMSKHIFALETGLSSDPEMNWRLSQLDKYSLVSNSDSHSPYPWRMGRECNVFEMADPTYDKIFEAIKTRKNFAFTVETEPSYGKYHYDGHRNCGLSFSPKETRKLKGICPKCKRPLTIGVENRVEELADRESGFVPPGSVPFKKALPLHEIISKAEGVGTNTKSCWDVYNSILARFGSEFDVLLNVPPEEISTISKPVASVISLMRKNNLEVKPGYDGVYGELLIKKEKKLSDYFQ